MPSKSVFYQKVMDLSEVEEILETFTGLVEPVLKTNNLELVE
jgi:hypothetical protein